VILANLLVLEVDEMAAALQTYPTGSQQQSPPNGQVGIAQGPQASQFQLVPGTFVCNGATPVTVVAASLTATSLILISLKTVGGTVGAIPAVQTVTPGTGFTVAGTASDTSTYSYLIIG
jgi:hypothetical protein